ncbi:MAG TPA: hypothetical protein ENK33_11585 [Desulfobacterales bacterium]|nr:hypothetical protein [Desulfobacterales bacterium]
MIMLSDFKRANNKFADWPAWLGLLLIILATVWLRWHLLGVALERDEGEYAYGGQLLLQGIPPYTLLYNMKLPGIYVLYALLIKLLGASPWGIHAGLLMVNIINSILIFLIGRRQAGALAGVAAAGVFAVLSMGQPVQGVFANAEHFVIMASLSGVLLLLMALDSQALWGMAAAGFMFGCAFIIKQHGLFFILWGAGYGLGRCLLARRPGDRPWAWALSFSLGVFLPYIITCLWLYEAGVFSKFWFWTIEYASRYSEMLSWADAWRFLSGRLGDIISASPLLWLSSGAGFIILVWRYRGSELFWFLSSFTVFSAMAVAMGGYFRPHYFIFILPAVALLAGLPFLFLSGIMANRGRIMRYGLPVALLIVFIGASLYNQRHFLWESTPEAVVRETYWPNPFVESLAVGNYLRTHAKKNDRLMVFGSEPQLYFYSGLKSASGYIYMYPLMENQPFARTMQRELIKEVELAKPQYLVMVNISYSWLRRRTSNPLIFNWLPGYLKKYKRVGMVEIYQNQSRYSWQPTVVWPPSSPYWIEIMRRKSDR